MMDRRRRTDGWGGTGWAAACWILMWLPLGWGMGMLACTRTWGYAVGLALAFAALAAVSARLGWRGGRWGAPWFQWAWWALAAWAIASGAWAPVATAARWDALKWAAVAGMGWAWTGLARERGAWRVLLGGVFALVAAECLYGLLQHVNGSNWVLWMPRPETYGSRVSGTYLCPNHFANVAAMAVPMALAVLPCRGAGLPLKLLAGYTLAAALPGLYWSQSRSAWLGVLGGLAAAGLAWAWKKSRAWFFAGLLAAPLLAAGVGALAWKTLPAVRERMDLIGKGREDGEYGGNGRLNMWRDTFAMWRTKAAAGYGGGSYVWEFPRHQRHARANLLYDYAHNEYLQVLAEYGAVGAALLGLAVLAWLAWTARALRQAPRGGDAAAWGGPGNACGTALLAGAAGTMAATGIHAVFDFNFHIFPNPHVWAAFVGIACGAWLGERDAEAGNGGRDVAEKAWRLPLRRAAGLALAAAWAWCGWTAVRGGVSYWLWLKAEAASAEMEWDEAEAYCARSAAWDGENADPWAAKGDILARRAFWFRGAGLGEEERERKRTELAERAEAAYEAALARNPLHAMALNGAGKTRALRGDAEGALEAYRRAAEMNPYDRELGEGVAKQLEAMDRRDEAREWLAERRKTWDGRTEKKP